MDVQLSPGAIFDCDSQYFRLEPRASAGLASPPPHESANPIAGELTLRLLIEPLHLRHQAFERSPRFLFLAITAEAHFDLFRACAEVESLLEVFRQLGKRYVFIHAEMFH